MAVAVYTPLNAPLLTTTDLTAALRLTIPTSWNIPVYDDYPSDLDIVRFGVYVSDIHTVDRNPYKLGVTYGGDIYNADDNANAGIQTLRNNIKEFKRHLGPTTLASLNLASWAKNLA